MSVPFKCNNCINFGDRCCEQNGETPIGDCLNFTPRICIPDPVNHPSHYTQGGIECIRAIEASMTPEGFQDYCKGNIIKYIWRFRNKLNPVEDLKKAQVYLGWMIESAEKGATDGANTN